MPFPTPREGENRKSFIERCHRAEAEGIPQSENRHKACMDAWRKAKAKSVADEAADKAMRRKS